MEQKQPAGIGPVERGVVPPAPERDDHALLALAGAAADCGVRWEVDYGCYSVPGDPEYGPHRWNPLTNDGDALRLAVRLNIDVLQRAAGECWAQAPMVRTEIEPHGTDAAAATRRAITRAAAALADRKRHND